MPTREKLSVTRTCLGLASCLAWGLHDSLVFERHALQFKRVVSLRLFPRVTRGMALDAICCFPRVDQLLGKRSGHCPRHQQLLQGSGSFGSDAAVFSCLPLGVMGWRFGAGSSLCSPVAADMTCCGEGCTVSTDGNVLDSCLPMADHLSNKGIVSVLYIEWLSQCCHR